MAKTAPETIRLIADLLRTIVLLESSRRAAFRLSLPAGGAPDDGPCTKESMAVVFYLLTSTATAYGECAWVLWEHTWRDASWWRPWISSSDRWTANGAVKNREDCEKGQARIEELFYSPRDVALKVNPRAVDAAEHAQWIC